MEAYAGKYIKNYLQLKRFSRNSLQCKLAPVRGPVAQLVEQRFALREVVSSTLAGPTLRVLKITEEKVLPL